MALNWNMLVPFACIAAGIYLLFGREACGWTIIIMGALMIVSYLAKGR